jgi:hypothetical protein
MATLRNIDFAKADVPERCGLVLELKDTLDLDACGVVVNAEQLTAGHELL